MVLQGDGSYLVTPDVKKGLISVIRANDGTTHLRWIDRSTNSVVDDYVLVRDEVTFKSVNTGRPSDRVYILKWSNGNTRHMFWMQHKNPTDDTVFVTKVNECINAPPPAQTPDWMQLLR
jgi:hypothetical protein